MNKDELKKRVCTKKQYPLDYAPNYIEAIKDMTISDYKIVLFGSSVFKAIPYAGDIDLLQEVPANKILSLMQTIVQRLLIKKYLIGDIKAGIYPELIPLMLAVGEVKNGKIIGYDQKIIEKYNIEYNLNLKNIQRPRNFREWMDIHNQIHDVIVVRVTPQELMYGWKNSMGKLYSLKETICNIYGLNKIDAYAWLNNKFIEITNVLIFDKALEYRQSKQIYGIKIDLFKNLFADNYTKALKRAYTLARIMNMPYELQKLTPFLSSNENLAASVLTDLKVLEEITTRINIYNIINKISIFLQTMIIKLSNVYVFDTNIYIEAIKNIMMMINKPYYRDTDLQHDLEILIDNYKHNVNDVVVVYIKNHAINFNSFVP